MPALTLVASYLVNSGGNNTSTLTTPSFSPAIGEIIVVKAFSGDASDVLGTPTGGGGTYTQRAVDTTISHVYGTIWTSTTTSASSTTVSLPWSSGGGAGHSMVVERWSNATLAATPATTDTRGSGAPSATITTVGANSVVSWGSSDWAAVDGASRSYRTTSATPTEDGYYFLTGDSTSYYAYQSAASAGSQTFGLTAPTGQTYTVLAIEILQVGGVSGPTFRLRKPGGGSRLRSGDLLRGGQTTVTVTVTDGGSANDNLTITATVSLSEAGSGADAVVTSAAVPLADSGAGTDALATGIAISPSDSGTGTDTLTTAAAVPQADSGTGSDQLAVSAAVPLAESGSGADSFAVSAAVPLTDSGTGTDALTTGIAITPADSGSGADALTVAAAVPLADSGTGSEQLSVVAAVPLAAAGTGVDQLAVTVAAPLADIGTGADALTAGIGIALADSGTGADSLAVVRQVALADSGTGSDAFAVAVAVGLAETGAGAELLTVAASVGLAETGAGNDTLVIIQGLINQPGTVTATDLAAGAARAGDASGSITMGDKPIGGETGGTKP